MPMPPEAFSPLATTKSTRKRSTRRGTSSSMARRPGDPTMSPTNRMRMPGLPGVVHRTGFPDDGYFDLPRVGELPLDLLGHVPAEQSGLLIPHLLALHDETDLPAGLN